MFYSGKILTRKIIKTAIYGFAIYGMIQSGACSALLGAQESTDYAKPIIPIVQQQETVKKSSLEKIVNKYELKQYQRN